MKYLKSKEDTTMSIDSEIKFKLVGGTKLIFNQENIENILNNWRSENGPPVPVAIDEKVWNILVNAVIGTSDPANNPRVFRLYMQRHRPRHVIETSEIEDVWMNLGVIRWEERGFPARNEPIRKGGNCFIRGDVKLNLTDAWWMGRELTDLRILMMIEENKKIVLSAWWSRGNLGPNGTNGNLWPVKLIIKK